MCVCVCVCACVRACVLVATIPVFHLQCSLFELMLNVIVHTAMVMSGLCPDFMGLLPPKVLTAVSGVGSNPALAM